MKADLSKRWIEDVPDPENPGKTNAEELYSIWKSILKYRDLQYSPV